jgi:LacI family transcriptional regulator
LGRIVILCIVDKPQIHRYTLKALSENAFKRTAIMSFLQATISDVAKRAGVSISTVSRVLNNTAPVDTSTAEKVRTAVAELKYIPRAAARTLASRRTNTIGLQLEDIGGEFYTPLLRGIEAVVSEAGYSLLIHSSQASRAGMAKRGPLGEHNTDGLLVFTGGVDKVELVHLHEVGLPVVMLHSSPPRGLEIPVITIENRIGAQRIVEHLIKVHNCRKILFMHGPEGNEDSEEREKGYRQALKAHNLPYRSDLVAIGGYDPGQAYTAVKQKMAQGADFDAIFTGDDDNAVGVIQALREARWRIPQDVAVVGFDDSLFARILTPPLTTVRAPIEQVGREAARQLIRQIRGETVEPRLTLPVELVIRQSCGCMELDLPEAWLEPPYREKRSNP